MLPEEMVDQPENLLLLCRVHHKMVDDQFETYSAQMLKTLKANHERWVSTTLTGNPSLPPSRVVRIAANIPTHLVRLTSGSDVFGLLSSGHAFLFEQDELGSAGEVELVANFFQEAQDWGDLASDLEAGDRVKAAHRISKLVQELQESQLLLFGAREVRRLEGGVGPPQPFVVTILRVARAENPEIIKFDGANPDKGEHSGEPTAQGSGESDGDV
jgi:hypothetical protein